jgi:hypothetical protein
MSNRDRRFLGVLIGAAVLAVGVGIYLGTSRSAPRADADCVVVEVASTLGGATLRNCGRAAERFCRNQAPLSKKIADACRRQGFPAPPTR